MRVAGVKYSKEKVEPPAEFIAFPTAIGDRTYLNVVPDQNQIKHLDENGWKAKVVDSYTFLRYEVAGNKLVIWTIDDDAKKRAIQEGKVKGVVEPNKPDKFADTPGSPTLPRTSPVSLPGRVIVCGDTKTPKRFEKIEMPPPIVADEKNEQAVKKAVEAANVWLALVDQGSMQEWDTAAEYLRNAVGKEQFVSRLRPPGSLWERSSRERSSAPSIAPRCRASPMASTW